MVILPLYQQLPDLQDVFVVGADRGALMLARQGITMDLALGDFDSVSRQDMPLIRAHAREIIYLNPIKDDSDSEACVSELRSRGFARITLYGGFSGRVDHTVVNLRLTEKFPGQVYAQDERNLAWSAGPGSWEVRKKNYPFLSLFALEDSVLSLTGMKYPLREHLLHQQDLLGLSNEILGESGTVTVHSGKILLIQSGD